mgnify:CR=1 FL=1
MGQMDQILVNHGILYMGHIGHVYCIIMSIMGQSRMGHIGH